MKRTLAEFGPLSDAEQKIWDDLPKGEDEVIIQTTRPTATAGPDLQVRASFLRYLCTGACDAFTGTLPEKGIRIWGARVTGTLDLEGVTLPHDLGLLFCHLDQTPNLRSASLHALYLNNAHLPGLTGDRLQAEGGVFLRGAEVRGEVRLLGATLGGVLFCEGATLRAEGDALSCDGLQAEGGVFLRGAEVRGTVRLLGATLGGNLDCDGARLTAEGNALHCDRLQATGGVFLRGAEVRGTVRLLGAKLGGNLSCVGARLTAPSGGWALSASGAQIDGSFFLRPLDETPAKITGRLDLTAARIGSIADHPNSWPSPGNLVLDRCQYGAFTGTGISAAERIKWLELQDPAQFGQDFWPQPWEHCAKVLREMGHAEDARAILIRKEQLQRADRQNAFIKAGRGPRAAFMALTTDLLNLFVAHGHRPLRALSWLFCFWVLGVVIFLNAAAADALKPNNPFVLRSPEWYACAPGYQPTATIPARNPDGALSQLACFQNQPEARSYPAFRAGIYSADTLLPIVQLEMQEFWIPDETTATGKWARSFLWLQIAAGWFLSLLAVAGFSGLVKSD